MYETTCQQTGKASKPTSVETPETPTPEAAQGAGGHCVWGMRAWGRRGEGGEHGEHRRAEPQTPTITLAQSESQQ